MTADVVAVEHLLREVAPQVLGALSRRQGDFAAAEDAVQEAMKAAPVPVRPCPFLALSSTLALPEPASHAAS